MKEHPKILISYEPLVDPNDPLDENILIYSKVENNIKSAFDKYGDQSFDISSSCIRSWLGFENDLQYAYNNDISIVVRPNPLNAENELDISKRFYPAVNIIKPCCSESHIQGFLLDIPQHIVFVGAGYSQNNTGYNIDFWDTDGSSPDYNDIVAMSGYVAGLFLRMIYLTDLNFWQVRDLFMRSSDHLTFAHEPVNLYRDHYTEENGFGQIKDLVAYSYWTSNQHTFQKDPFLLYKLRSTEMTEQTLLLTSVKMTADRTKHLFIGLDGSHCGAGAKALGVLNADTAEDEYGPVATSGIVLVTTGAAISQGDAVESNSTGKAITNASGIINGYALDSATGADQRIRVKLV